MRANRDGCILSPVAPTCSKLKAYIRKAFGLGLSALACLLVAVPAAAQVNYGVSGNTAFVATSPNAAGDIVIASTFNGYPVTSIRDYAFLNRTGLTSVTIPASVASIGGGAFLNCSTSADFVDPQWAIQPRRFYRARSD